MKPATNPATPNSLVCCESSTGENPFASDAFASSTSFILNQNESVGIPTNGSYRVDDINLTVTGLNQTIDQFQNTTEASSPPYWTAQNQTDLNYEWNKTLDQSQVVSLNISGDHSNGYRTPLNRSSGVEDFWSQGNWIFQKDRTWDDVFLYRQDSGDENPSDCLYFNMSQIAGTSNASATRKFDYVYDDTPLLPNSSLKFDYILYNYTAPTILTLTVLIVDAFDTEHVLWVTQQKTSPNIFGSHEIAANPLQSIFQTTGEYDLVFQVEVMSTGSGQYHKVQIDKIELILSHTMNRIESDTKLTWNATIPTSGTPIPEKINASFSFSLSEPFPGINFSTSWVGLEVNGTWVDVYPLTELQGSTLYHVPNVTFPASLFAGLAVEVKIGIRVGADHWEVLPSQSFAIEFHNISCFFDVQSDPASFFPHITVQSMGSLLDRYETSPGLAIFSLPNHNSSRWGFGETAQLGVNISARVFVAEIRLDYILVSWRQEVYSALDAIFTRGNAYLDLLANSLTQVLNATWDKAIVRLVASRVVYNDWERGSQYAVLLGPHGVDAIRAVSGTLDQFLNQTSLISPNLTRDGLFSFTESLLADYYEKVLSGEKNTTTFVSESLEPLRDSFSTTLQEITGFLSTQDLKQFPQFDTSHLLTALQDLQFQIADLQTVMRMSALLPGTTQSPDGILVFGNSLRLLATALKTSDLPLVPLSYMVDAKGYYSLTSGGFLPILNGSVNGGTGQTAFISATHERELLGFLGTALFSMEVLSWRALPNSLGLYLNETLKQTTGLLRSGSLDFQETIQGDGVGSIRHMMQITGESWTRSPWVIARSFHGTTKGAALSAEIITPSIGEPTSSAGAVEITETTRTPLEVLAAIKSISNATILPSPVLSCFDLVSAGTRVNITVISYYSGWRELGSAATVNFTSISIGGNSTEYSTPVTLGIPQDPLDYSAVYLLGADPGIDMVVQTATNMWIGASNSTREVVGISTSAAYYGQFTSVETILLENMHLQATCVHGHWINLASLGLLVPTQISVQDPVLFIQRTYNQTIRIGQDTSSLQVDLPLAELSGFGSSLQLNFSEMKFMWEGRDAPFSVQFSPRILNPGCLTNLSFEIGLPSNPNVGNLNGSLIVQVTLPNQTQLCFPVKIFVEVTEIIELREIIMSSGLIAFLLLFGAVNTVLFVVRLYKSAIFSKLKLRS